MSTLNTELTIEEIDRLIDPMDLQKKAYHRVEDYFREEKIQIIINKLVVKKNILLGKE